MLPAEDVRDAIAKHYDLVLCTPVGLSREGSLSLDDLTHVPHDDQDQVRAPHGRQADVSPHVQPQRKTPLGAPVAGKGDCSRNSSSAPGDLVRTPSMSDLLALPA